MAHQDRWDICGVIRGEIHNSSRGGKFTTLLHPWFMPEPMNDNEIS